jgi:hypothetical protein
MIMVLVTALAPVTISNVTHTVNDVTVVSGYSIIALVWSIWPEGMPLIEGVQILNLYDIIQNIPFTGLTLLYCWFFLRYAYGQTEKKFVYLTAILSILLSSVIGILAIISRFLVLDLFLYDGPIPIQFIIGLILLRYVVPKREPIDQYQANVDDWLGTH